MIVLQSDDPQGLLDAIYNAIDNGKKSGIKIKENKERVITWDYDKDKYFHHDPDTNNDWANKAWFRPSVYPVKKLLIFSIDGPDSTMAQNIYGLFHGRFLGMMLSHFPDLFTVRDITPKPLTSERWTAYFATL